MNHFSPITVCGGLIRSNAQRFLAITLRVKNPSIPNFPLEASILYETISEGISSSASVSDELMVDSISELMGVIGDVLGYQFADIITESVDIGDTSAADKDIYQSITQSISILSPVSPDHLSELLAEGMSVTFDLDADELIRIKRVFPNLSGKHLTLRFITAGSSLYFMRMKMFKENDRVDYDARHPNLGGKHLTLRLLHETDADLTLGYSSMGMFREMAHVDYDARHPNLSGNHLTLRASHTEDEAFTLAYASMNLFGKLE